ncbi:MAG TPA: S41 family peptidase [Pyrinomonadaceae bacterium]|nr:S41 family peptidase [Pyrinomonadaceae bacterium]
MRRPPKSLTAALLALVILSAPWGAPASDARQTPSQQQPHQTPSQQPPTTTQQQPARQRRQVFPPEPRPAPGGPNASLFENVTAVLRKSYHDERFRKEELPALASRYAERAARAKTIGEQREVVQEFLSHIPATHLGLMSRRTYRYVMNELAGRAYPTFGFQLVRIGREFYIFALLEGGPGLRAGLLSWDRVVTIDGTPVSESARLDWRSDDAHLTDERDPPVHFLAAERGETVKLRVERRPGKFLDLTVAAEDYSSFEAAKASARVMSVGGRRVGYIHFWFIHMTGVPEMLASKLTGEFRDCDAIVLDLRGRGGNGMAIQTILDVLRKDGVDDEGLRPKGRRPFVALFDRQSRSAKDVLAYELKKTGLARVVGEQTAGAVIPATFADVGHETILMFPSFKLPRYTDVLELRPVAPDVFVERAGPLSAGADPILDAGLAEAVRLLKSPASDLGMGSWPVRLSLAAGQ